jgi:hypothetical protein
LAETEQPAAQGTSQPQPPPLAKPDAARKVGEGLRERVGETIDDTGKLLAAIAGAGIFFFGAGYFVEWQRFKRGGLPPEEILPLIPKSQVAAAGVRELVISIFFGVLVLAILGWASVRLARWATGRTGRATRLPRMRRELAKVYTVEGAVPSLILGGLIFLFVPFGWAGVIVTVVLTLLLFYSLRLLNSYLRELASENAATFPLWRLLVAAALAAVVLTGVRQREFPETRAHVYVTLTNHTTIKGSYVGSDSDEVLVRLNNPGRQPQLLVLDRGEIAGMRLEKGQYIFPTSSSVFGKAFGVEFSCIPPECRAGDSRIGISTLF